MTKPTIKLFVISALITVLQIACFAQSERDLPQREETRRNFQLSPKAIVQVTTIYGPVDIVTTDADRAEVFIVRSASRIEDLDQRKISIDQTDTGLVIRGERDSGQGPAKVQHRIMLKIPRSVEVSVQSVNARVNIGEIDGPVRVARINGAVAIGRAASYVEASNVNGSLTMTLSELGSRGVRADDINGAVEIRFAHAVNADVRVIEFNGGVNSEIPDTTILERKPREIYYARIGLGGIPISIKDVNGGVRLALIGR